MLKTVELPPLTLTPQAMRGELKREMKMRAQVFPRWVEAGKISSRDADFRIRALDQILAVVEAVFADELRPAQTDMLDA